MRKTRMPYAVWIAILLIPSAGATYQIDWHPMLGRGMSGGLLGPPYPFLSLKGELLAERPVRTIALYRRERSGERRIVEVGGEYAPSLSNGEREGALWRYRVRITANHKDLGGLDGEEFFLSLYDAEKRRLHTFPSVIVRRDSLLAGNQPENPEEWETPIRLRDRGTGPPTLRERRD